MKKKKNLVKNEEGFTLIEIIAVLVIMGILAAVAIPKFFDLQERARNKAIYTAVSEMKVRVNQHFASQLLNGVVATGVTYIEGSVGSNLGDDFDITAWNANTTTGILAFNITYYPDPQDHTKNPVTTAVSIDLPQSGL